MLRDKFEMFFLLFHTTDYQQTGQRWLRVRGSHPLSLTRLFLHGRMRTLSKLRMLHLIYHKTYCHQIFKGWGLGLGVPTSKSYCHLITRYLDKWIIHRNITDYTHVLLHIEERFCVCVKKVSKLGGNHSKVLWRNRYFGNIGSFTGKNQRGSYQL